MNNKIYKKRSHKKIHSKAKTKVDKNLDKRIRKIEKRAELKFTLTGNKTIGVDDPIDNNGITYILNTMAIGTEPNERIGAKCTFTSVRLQGHIHPGFGVGATPTEVRVMILWDKQANHGNLPLFSTSDPDGVLDDSILVNAPVHNPYNQTALTRYKILYDKVFLLINQGNTDATTTNAIIINHKIKLGRTTQYAYESDTTTAADVTTNALWLFVCGNVDSASSAALKPKFLFNTIALYKDS